MLYTGKVDDQNLVPESLSMAIKLNTLDLFFDVIFGTEKKVGI